MSTLIDAVCVVFISIKRDDIIQGKFISVFNIVLLNVTYWSVYILTKCNEAETVRGAYLTTWNEAETVKGEPI